MKKGWVLIFLLSTELLMAQASWTKQYQDSTLQFNAVQWVGKDTGYVAGSRSMLFKTTNGGTTWLPSVYNPSGDTLKRTNWQGISFLSPLEGWLCGPEGQIATTKNGGQSWTKQATGTQGCFHDIVMESGAVGWAVGTCGLVQKWNGSSWQSVNTGIADHLLSAKVLTPGSQIITAAFGNVPSGGSGVWQNAVYPATEELFEIAKFNNTLLAVGISDTLFSSIDKGNTWKKIKTPSRNMYCIAMMSETEWLIAGFGGKVFRTTDGGTNWKDETPTAPKSTGDFKAIYANTKGQFYSLVNNNGEIWKVQLCNVQATLTSSSTNICPGDTIKLKATGGVSYKWSEGGSSQDSIAVAPLQSTSYSVTVTDNKGCSFATSIPINTYALPQVNAGTDVKVCVGTKDTVNLKATGTAINYQWSNMQQGASNTVQVKLGAIYYIVTATSNQGCQSFDTVIVQGLSNPILKINGVADNFVGAVCSGKPIDLTATGGNQYIWSNGTTGNMLQIKIQGNYGVTTTDNNGCKAIGIITINNGQGPAISGLVDTSFCSGKSVTLSLTASGVVGYKWSTNSNQPSINVNNIGNYTVTVTDTIGCTSTKTVLVTQKQSPTISIGTDLTLCEGTIYKLKATGGDSYLWNFNNETKDTLSIIVDKTTKNYSVIGYKNGCESTATIKVTGIPMPVVNIKGNQPICKGSSLTLDASIAGNYTYNWGNNIFSPTNQVTPTDTTIYTVTITNNGCSNSGSVKVIVNPLPLVNINTTGRFCETDTLIITATGGNKFEWNNVNGGIVNGNKLIFNQLNLQNSGNYAITVTDINNCKATENYSLTVKKGPSAQLTGPAPRCKDDLASKLELSQLNGNSFVWLFKDGTPDLNFKETFKLVYQGDKYSVKVDSSNGCSRLLVFDLILKDKPSLKVTGDSIICKGLNTELSAEGGNNVSFEWLGFSAATKQNKTQLLSPQIDTKYWVVAFNSVGCSDTVGKQIAVHELPIAKITDKEIQNCSDSIALLGNSSPGYIGNWTTTGTANIQQNKNEFEAKVTKLPEGGSKFLWTVKSDVCPGESRDSLLVFRVNQKPSTKDDNSLALPLQKVQIDVASNDSIAHIKKVNWSILEKNDGDWTIDTNGLVSYISNDVNFGGFALAKYLVCNDLCPNLCSIGSIRVLVDAPKLGGDDGEFISPNEDGINDGLEFEYLDKYPDNEIVIFNRWGSEVFRAKPYRNGESWKGKNKSGGVLPDGTYYYFLILNGTEGKKSIYGSVLLLK